MAFYISQKYNALLCCNAGKYIAVLSNAEEIAFVLTSKELEFFKYWTFSVENSGNYMKFLNSMIVPLQK